MTVAGLIVPAGSLAKADESAATPIAEAAGNGTVADSVSVVAVEPETAISVETARDRARLMLKVYSSTLDVLHDHYFHANRAVLPARAMEDIFAETAQPIRAETRWIAVNAKAMSVDHEPADEFEKEAARRIAAGDKALEKVEGNTYRFAGSIPLHASCVQCHMGSFGPPSKKDRFAGLVINIPLSKPEAK
jgi:hypothetical protein